MADPVLHIKDSYYFEVPKVLWPYDYRSRRQFPEVWVSLDAEYQEWEAQRLYDALTRRHAPLPPKNDLLAEWRHWQHADEANFAKPLKVFLEEKYEAASSQFRDWKADQLKVARTKRDGSIEDARRLEFGDYLSHLRQAHRGDTAYLDYLDWRHKNEGAFDRARAESSNVEAWKQDKSVPEWSPEKIAAYNGHLSGKILIPQPFGTQRNLYEMESGFGISKYMVIQVVIGLILVLVFAKLAQRAAAGGPPRGYLWNLLEAFLLFIRDDIVRPSVGGHHAEEHGEGHMPKEGHAHGTPYGEHGGRGHDDALAHHHASLGGQHVAAAHGHGDDVTRLVPLFWTIFFFVLGCNLFGMLPWLGAPSASFSVTTGLALVTFVVGMYAGIRKFGFFGHLGNQIPSMDLPWYIAFLVKPLVYAIEVLGLMIKHGVLAIRLLANMVAGHLVILGIMGVAFGATAAAAFSEAPLWQWSTAAVIAVIASTLFSLLELFVAFLQAYIFTFLSALFIGAALHRH